MNTKEQELLLLSEPLYRRQRQYWLTQLSEWNPEGLRADACGAQPPVQQRMELTIPAELGAVLIRMSKNMDLSLYLLLLTTLKTLMHLYTGSDDISVLSPVYQPNCTPQTLNTFVILRDQVSREMRFKELLLKVRETAVEAYENQDVPLKNLLKGTSEDGRRELVVCLYKSIHDEIILQQSTSDLLFAFENTASGLQANVFFDTGVYRRELVEQFGQHYLRTLQQVLANPEMKIAEISLLSEAEEMDLLLAMNQTMADYPHDQTIHQLFEAQVERTPENIAVVFADQHITYRELNHRANQLAHTLRNRGVKPETLIAIVTERSIEMIIGILGILKSGGTYLPIDPGYPEERIQYMLTDSGCTIALVGPGTADLHRNSVTTILDLTADQDDTGDGSNVDSLYTPTDLAYIIYTSGTTGRPKGTMIEHRNVVRLLFNDAMPFDFTSADIWTMFHSMCFDFSVWEMYGALLYGGKLVIIPKQVAQDAGKFLAILVEEKVTILNQTPSAFANLTRQISGEAWPDLRLRYVIFGGEALQPAVLKTWQANYLETKWINMYGITETTVHVTLKEITLAEMEANVSNIGKPLPTLTTYVMDANLRLLPKGVPGELCVGGEGVARGYLYRPELTVEKFIQNPYNPHERLYRSGDLVRWLHQGELEYLGRIDQQVKIRGFRVEPGEIEHHLIQHEKISQAVVIVRAKETGDSYLCAYIVTQTMIGPGELRDYLAQSLPEYMIPSYFIRLDEIPLTGNGKVDRQALPTPSGRIGRENPYVAPDNPIEARLVQIWEMALEAEKIGVTDTFFELGGHSLKATMLIGQMYKEFGVKVPLREFFKRLTIQSIAAYIHQSEMENYDPIEPAEKREFYVVSSAQKRLFILKQREGEGIGYNVPMVLLIEGKLDLDKMERIFATLVERHEALRTSFLMVENTLVQQVHSSVEFAMTRLEDENQTIAKTIQTFIHPFDLGQAPLFRVGLRSLEAEKHILLLDMHHIISDGISVKILMDEFAQLYEEEPLVALRLQYKDYSEWQNSQMQLERFKEQAAYWLQRFSEEIPLLDLPTDFPRPALQSYEGDMIAFSIDPFVTDGLRRIAKETECTMYMVLLSALTILISKHSGQEDIIIGSSIAGRPYADLDKIIGMFANTLAMRNAPVGSKRYDEFLMEVKENALEAYENQDYPFDELVTQLKIPASLNHNPLFDILFEMQTMEQETRSVQGLTFKLLGDAYKVAKFDLTFAVNEGMDDLFCHMGYCTKLFMPKTIQSMVEHLRKILQSIVADPTIRICEIDLLTDEEKQILLYDFNNNFFPFPRDKSVDQLFEEWVEKTPEQIAVKDDQVELTYQRFNARANQIARYLTRLGLQNEGLVGIMLHRSHRMVESILGVWKAGGAYIPIDVTYPISRITGILQDSGAQILITSSEWVTAELETAFAGMIVLIDEDQTRIAQEVEANLSRNIQPHNLAYVIYTSGSTGKPKGAMVEQIGMMNHIQAKIHDLHLSQTSVIAQNASHCFDISVWQFFTTLVIGGTTVIYSNEIAAHPNDLVDHVIEDRITILEVVPSFLSVMLTYLAEYQVTFQHLQYLLVTGEELKAHLVKTWFSLYPSIKMVNAYGPTEASDDITHYIMENDPGYDHIPIGSPVQNFRIYVVDKYMKLCPIGTKGEIMVAGIGVGRGYRNDLEKTQKAFAEDPFVPEAGVRLYKTGDLGRWLPNGTIQFFGRIDYQVKIRGFRIELGEIEKQLLSQEGIGETVVVARENANGDKYLCAYFVGGREFGAAELRGHLAQTLPEYMVPAYFIQLDSLPLNANGKIDRKALPEPDGSISTGMDYAPPRNEIEERLVDIWKQVLGVENIGIHNNFFEVGGNSMNILQVINTINKEFTEISLTELFVTPTIAKMAEKITMENKLLQLESVVGLNSPVSGRKNLFILHGREGTVYQYKEFARLLENEYNVFGIQARGLTRECILPETVDDVVDHYLQEMQSIQSEGPYLIAGYCHGMIFGYDLVWKLEEKGEQVEMFLILDEQVYLREQYVRRMRLNTYLAKPLKAIANLTGSRPKAGEHHPVGREVQFHTPEAIVANLDSIVHGKLKLRTIIHAPIYVIKAKDSVQERLTIEEWSKMTRGTVTIGEVPGDHDSILNYPDVLELTEAVRQIPRGENDGR